jgi:hypothetical protein
MANKPLPPLPGASRSAERPLPPIPGSAPSAVGPSPVVPGRVNPPNLLHSSIPDAAAWPKLGTSAAEELSQVGKGMADAVREDGHASRLDKAYAALDIISLAIDAGTIKVHDAGHAYTSSQGFQTLGRGVEALVNRKVSDIKVRPNPWFVANGHDERQSPVTQTYLRNRSLKTVGSAAVGLAGNVAEVATHGVNVTGALQHLSALGSTGAHWLKIRAIARSYKNTVTISRWCDAIMRMKQYKLVNRALQLADEVIPVPIADQVVNITAAAAALGYRIGLGELCYITAIEIHWRAFQEQAISAFPPRRPMVNGGVGDTPQRRRPSTIKVGPASRIFAEVFTRRGVTAAFGSYNVAALIQEPAGWMALGDKVAQA